LPNDSVGTRQLRNAAVTANKLAKASITPTKLNGSSIPGYVAFWAEIDGTGRVLASSKPATTTGWTSSGLGTISFHGTLSSKCFPLANVSLSGTPSFPQGGQGYVDISSGSPGNGTTAFAVAMATSPAQPGPEPINVAEICP
jgi:hypothetical protein